MTANADNMARFVYDDRSVRGQVDLWHLDGVAWFNAPIPPVKHVCWAQTMGWRGLDLFDRCACGAMQIHRSGWACRNERRKRTSSNDESQP